MATLLSIAARRDRQKPGPRREHLAVPTPPADDCPADTDEGYDLGLDALSAWYYRRWQPVAREERHLVDALILAEWQLRRLQMGRQWRPPESA